MEGQQLFRKKSLERISSPEQLDDYLHVTTPSVWLVMGAMILLLAGILLWGRVASIGSYVSGTAVAKDGTLTIRFEDQELAKNVQVGMKVSIGEVETTISSIGYAAEGSLVASAPIVLGDGVYEVRVEYRTTQVMKLLFGRG